MFFCVSTTITVFGSGLFFLYNPFYCFPFLSKKSFVGKLDISFAFLASNFYELSIINIIISYNHTVTNIDPKGMDKLKDIDLLKIIHLLVNKHCYYPEISHFHILCIKCCILQIYCKNFYLNHHLIMLFINASSIIIN